MPVNDTNLWRHDEHARAYLQRADTIPRRQEGQAALLEALPATTRRVLDLGSGDGRLLASVLERLPEATGVALDFSAEMLRQSADLARSTGAYWQTHIAEDRREIDEVLELFPGATDYTDVYDRAGGLGPKPEVSCCLPRLPARLTRAGPGGA